MTVASPLQVSVVQSPPTTAQPTPVMPEGHSFHLSNPETEDLKDPKEALPDCYVVIFSFSFTIYYGYDLRLILVMVEIQY